MLDTGPEFAALRSQAITHHKSGNLAAAISDYEKLLKRSPDDADCLGLLAMALHQTGRRETARSTWLASLSLAAETYIHLRNLNNFIAAALGSGSDLDAETLKMVAVPDWPASRLPAKAEKETIISLARGLLKIGKGEEALRLIDSTSQFAGDDLIFARNFADILMEAGHPERAHQLLANIPDDGLKDSGEILLARAATAYAAGLNDEAIQLTKAAVAALPVHITAAQPEQEFLIGVINPAPGIVTAIMSPQLFHFSSNSPAALAWSSSHLYRLWSVFPESPGAAAAMRGLLRPDLILNNWVNGERLSTPDTLELIAGFADRLELPVLNHPRKAALATRQRNAERLSDIPGLVVPRIARFLNEAARLQHLVRSIGENFGFPVIIRDPFRQMGKQAEKITSARELETHLGNISGKQLYAIEFIDNPVAGGFYRKVRAAVFGGDPIISHVHFGERWNVHRERDSASAAEHSVPPAEEAFARAILFKPEEAIGRSGMAALREIGARIPLEFYGIDFDILPDGRLVFFEANATMNISLTGQKSKGLEPIRAKMREAFHRLLKQTSGRNHREIRGQ